MSVVTTDSANTFSTEENSNSSSCSRTSFTAQHCRPHRTPAGRFSGYLSRRSDEIDSHAAYATTPSGPEPECVNNATWPGGSRNCWRPTPLSQILISMPGVVIRTGARSLIVVGDGSSYPSAAHLAAYDRPGNPQLGLLDPRRTALPPREQAAQTGLLPLRLRSPRRPGVPRLLRQEDRPGQAPHPGSALLCPAAGRRPFRDAPWRNPLRTPTRAISMTRPHAERLHEPG